MTSLKNAVSSIASQGRGGDAIIGHLTPGDVVIPAEIQTPDVKKALKAFFAKHGVDASEFEAGHPSNKKNPETGAPEFGWLSDIFDAVRDPVEAIAADVGNYFLPGSSILTDQILSKGAQQDQSSLLGQIGQIGSGLAGSGAFGPSGTGSSLIDLGIPQSAGGAFESGLLHSAENAVGLGGSGAVGAPPGTSSAGTGVGAAGSSAAGISGGGFDPATGIGTSPDATLAASQNPDIAQAFTGATQSNAGTTFGDVASQLSSGTQGLPWQAPGYVNPGASDATLPWQAPGYVNPGAAVPTTTGALNGIIPSGATPTNAATGGFDLNGNMVGGTQPGDVASQLAGGAAKAPNSFGQFISNPTLGNFGNILTSNPASLIAAGGVGLDLLKGNQQTGAEKNLKADAAQLGAQGQQLESYLQSGTLPPGLQQGITQAADSAKAAIRSQFAAQGMSGSSAEQQALAQVDINAQAAAAQQAEQLLTTGMTESGMASTIYQNLMNDTLNNDKNLQSAIGNFASAAAGGGKAGQIVLNTGAGGNAG